MYVLILLELVELRLDLIAEQKFQIVPISRLVRAEYVDFLRLGRQEPVYTERPLRHSDQRNVLVPAALDYMGERIADLPARAITIDLLDEKRHVAERKNKLGDVIDLRFRIERPVNQPEVPAIHPAPEFPEPLGVFGVKNHAVGVFAERVENEETVFVFDQLLGKIRFARSALAEDQGYFFFRRLISFHF